MTSREYWTAYDKEPTGDVMTGRWTMIVLTAWILYRLGSTIADVFTRAAETLGQLAR